VADLHVEREGVMLLLPVFSASCPTHVTQDEVEHEAEQNIE
jgi:hypothetical protein